MLNRLRGGFGLRRRLGGLRLAGRARALVSVGLAGASRPAGATASPQGGAARRVADDPALARLLECACSSFVLVQRAWDAADLERLAALTTQPLFQDLQAQLELRGPQEHPTEVLEVHASLAGFEQLAQAQVARIEFRGLIRERFGGEAAPFRELWLVALTPGDDSWRLAHVQALI